MILEESKHARNVRVAEKMIYRILAAVLTIGLLAADLYIIFSSSIAHRILIVTGDEPEMITLDIGPLITRLCHNVTHHGGLTISGGGLTTSGGGLTTSGGCISVLFYQLPLDDYAASSATLMIALWVPIIAGLLASRLTFWRVHSFLQFIISCGYVGVIYILLHDGYQPGMTTAIILGRVSWTAVFMFVTIAFIIVKCCREKYCSDIRDQPAIIGVGYDADEDDADEDDDDITDTEDMLSASYWNEQKRISI